MADDGLFIHLCCVSILASLCPPYVIRGKPKVTNTTNPWTMSNHYIIKVKLLAKSGTHPWHVFASQSLFLSEKFRIKSKKQKQLNVLPYSVTPVSNVTKRNNTGTVDVKFLHHQGCMSVLADYQYFLQVCCYVSIHLYILQNILADVKWVLSWVYALFKSCHCKR